MERIASRTDKSGDCWLWVGTKDRDGYGVINIDRRMRFTHRVVWEHTNGKSPKGLCVCHRCDEPACINPSHLFLGTHADNMRDMFAKGRANPQSRRGEKNARAKLTEAAVIAIRADKRPFRFIARDHGVVPAHISNVKARKTWRHVP